MLLLMAFSVDVEDLNSGPYVFLANTFPTEPFHWPSDIFLLSRSVYMAFHSGAITHIPGCLWSFQDSVTEIKSGLMNLLVYSLGLLLFLAPHLFNRQESCLPAGICIAYWDSAEFVSLLQVLFNGMLIMNSFFNHASHVHERRAVWNWLCGRHFPGDVLTIRVGYRMD